MTPFTRLAICRECPELEPLMRCGMCGCFMHVKARLKFAHCPMYKWDAVEEWSEPIPDEEESL